MAGVARVAVAAVVAVGLGSGLGVGGGVAAAGPAVSRYAPFCTQLAFGVRDLVSFGSVTSPAAAVAARTKTDRDLVTAAKLAPDHITRHEVLQEHGDFDALVSLAIADPHAVRPGTAAHLKLLTARGKADAALLGKRAAQLGCAPYLKH